jgi:hypothetical protein
MRRAPVFAPVFTALRRGELLRRGKVLNGERDRPGCRFWRRAENPSTNKFVQRWFGRDARTRTRDARAPPPIVHPKLNTGKEPFKCGMLPSSLPSSLRYDAASCFDAARSAPQFDFRHRPASCASPCEITPAPRLPVVFAVFHWASHAPRCPCGIRNV